MNNKNLSLKIIGAVAVTGFIIAFLNGLLTRNTSFDVDADEFEKLMSEPNAVVLDVRSASEYAKERIKGAVLFDYDSPAFKDQVKRFRKNRIYLVYCKDGNNSSKTCEIMSENGFERIYCLKDGIEGWKESRKPVIN